MVSKATQDEKNAAVAKYLAGKSCNALAPVYGVSAATISNWVIGAGYSLRHSGPQHKTSRSMRAAAVAERKAGATLRELAQKYSVSTCAIHNWSRDAGYCADYVSSPAIQEAAVKEYLEGNATLKVVGDKFGVSGSSVRRWVLAAGHSIRASHNHRSSNEKAAAVAEYLAGDSSRVVAQKYGVQAETVLCWVRAAGHSPRSAANALRVPYPYGELKLESSGYAIRYLHPDYWLAPHARQRRTGSQAPTMLEHRRVMAESLQRPLTAEETVHHLNGDKTDNRIENLELHDGNHGAGQRWVCANCGCSDRKAVPLGS